MAHDLVIRGGTIVDGTGAEPFEGDVAVDGDQVTAVGEVTSPGSREIDAAGAIVTPGFVDTHTHFDAQVGWDPLLTPSSLHGVTTVLIGNCGMSFAPVQPGRQAQLAHMMEAVEDIPAEAILSGLPWTWESYGEYLETVDGLRPALNVMGMMGHSALRYYVMGDDAVEGQPGESELARLGPIVAASVSAGGIGFSTSRFLGHVLPSGQHVPGTWARLDELLAIAGGLGERSLFQAVVNFAAFEDELAMLAQIHETSGCRIFMTAAVSDDPGSGKKLRAQIEELRAAGTPVTVTMAPRPGGLTISLEGSVLLWRTPAWLRLLSVPGPDRLAWLADAAHRDLLVAEAIESGPALPADLVYPLDVDGGLEYMAGPEGSLAQLAGQAGESVPAYFIRLLLESDGQAMFAGRLFNRDLDALADLLTSEHVLPGLGDAGAHVGQVMDAGWTTFFLCHWVRATGAFSLAEGVRRLTSAPADLLTLPDRGHLTPGATADVNVIDLDRLRLLPPEFVYDFPHGAGRLSQRAEGYRATLVNGRLLVENDSHTGQRPGGVLRATAG